MIAQSSPIALLRGQLAQPRTLVPVAIALGGLALALRTLLGLSLNTVWAELTHANPLLLALAIGVFYLTFPVRAVRWQALLENAGARDLPSLSRLTRMLVLGSFVNSVSVAQLGDLYRAYLLDEEGRVSVALALGTMLAERLVDLVTLVGLLAAAALTLYRGVLPRAGVDALLVGLAGSLLGMLGLALLPRSRPLVERIVPRRWQPAYARFEQGAVRSLDRLPLLFGCATLAWLIEGATLLLLARAIGIDLPATGALVTGLVASLLSVEPITPGGLGVTEPGIVLVLSSLGVGAAGASAIALLNRLVNYASLAVAGAILYLMSLGRTAGGRARLLSHQ
ncbi:MAG: flippase-like domain-containing protein [Chloroflexi bacterium]|nr:flippase-like domain-containing protein [Chloroflexota bacterium]